VNVALPTIGHGLGLSIAGLAWVAGAYQLTFGGFQLVGGRAADQLGRRRMFVTGLTVFTVASLLAGVARWAWLLLAARALQGIGAALVVPIGVVSLLLCGRLLPADELEPGTGTRWARLDLPGVLTGTSALLLIVYAITTAAGRGLDAVSLSAAAAGLALGTVFLRVEARTATPYWRCVSCESAT
jgi:MFS family permease